jgi:hypothetical protein
MKFQTLMIVTASILLFFTFSCKNNSTSTKTPDALEMDAVVTENAGLGWQINEVISTGRDIFLMTGGPEADAPNELSGLPSARKLKARAMALYNNNKVHLESVESSPILLKPMDEILLFFFEDSIKGEKLGAFHDEETGITRIYAVKYKFPVRKMLTYDSIEIKIDTRLTEDDSDDLLTNFSSLQLYKEDHFLQKVVGNIDFTDFVGNEATGLELTSTSTYHQRMKLEMLVQFIDINPDDSATIREDFTFDDGKTAYNSITFYANNTGEYEKKLRDDTVISGTFNALEDDLQGSLTQLIDLPAGRYIDKIMKSAQVSITLPDSILNAIYEEIVYFKSGDIDSAHIGIQVQEDGDGIIANFDVKKKNNAHGSFEYMESEDGSATLTGDWTTWNDYYILLEAEYFVEGSTHMHYEVFAPPYSPGDDPVLVVDYDILTGGSGEGTITYLGELYHIVFEVYGEATITKDGAETKVNLY